jgi:signal peptidase I
MISQRRPWLAGMLSLALPGLGQLYAGRPRAAAVAYLLSAVAAMFVLGAPLVLPIAPLNVLVALLALLAVLVGVPLHAAKLAADAPKTYELRRYNRWYVYLSLYALLALLVRSSTYVYAKRHLVEAFRVPSAAMEPTIHVGDYLYVAKWADARGDLRHGTLIAFESVEERGLKVIKRVLGLPGDTLAMERGILYRNGQQLAEPYTVRIEPGRSEDQVQRAKMRTWQINYLAGRTPEAYRPDLEEWGPVVVPADSLFVLGDNRDASYDSRYYGFVPQQNVLGQPRVVYFSYNAAGIGPPPLRVRWGRLGQELR